ncbi:MAG: sulfatase-like hydrolase/transferase [Opitutaceae bacterium]|nr:sulfatase-like hydrolase/transferase [Opitutaceae bacterium]
MFPLLALLAASGFGAADTLDFTGSLSAVGAGNRLSEPGYYIWCGSAIQGEDGRYYLFYSRWPEGSTGRAPGDEELFKGMGGWLKYSEIAVAASHSPTGPFKPLATVLTGTGDPNRWDQFNAHNPHVKRFGGKIYLYYIATRPLPGGVEGAPNSDAQTVQRAASLKSGRVGRIPYSDGQTIGVAVADSVLDLVAGRFRRSARPLMAPDGVTTFCRAVNPSVTQGRDGRFLMMFKSRSAPTGGHMTHWIAASDKPDGPFMLAGPALTEARYDAEDPYLWYDRERDRYYAIVKDFSRESRKLSPEWGALALVTSEKGFGDWQIAKHPLVSLREYTDSNGRKHRLENLERPQLLFDDTGRPVCLYAASSEEPLGRGIPTANLHFTLHLPGVTPPVTRTGAGRVSANAGKSAPPNLVVINVDDLGYGEVGAFGGRNRTPAIDRMAAEGRKLTSHYAAPVCSPSRAALMTGSYPKRVLPITGVLLPAAAVGLNPEERTMAEVLKDAGYATACIGKWHLGDQLPFLPTRQGFDSYFGIPYSNDMGPVADGCKNSLGQPPLLPKAKKTSDRGDTGVPPGMQPPLPLLENEHVIARIRADDQVQLTRRYTERAVAWIRQRHERPFFLYFAHTAVHFPVYPNREFVGQSGNGLLGDWVQEVDWSVGRVLEALREAKLDRNTLVLFTSDNGGPVGLGAVNTPLRGGKATTFEGGVRVCTIAWWPGKIRAGTSTDAITTMMDVLPTFAKLAGTSVPSERQIDGVDIWPVLAGNPAKPPRDSFFYFRGLTLEAVRSGPWKLHLRSGELHHLGNDVAESKNVAAEQPVVVERLRALAGTMYPDLGVDGIGAGCRPLGRVENPKPLIAADGSVRGDAIGQTRKFP